jgi:hypothetical protein
MKDLIVISLIIFVIYIIIKNKNTSKINSSNYKNKVNINKYKQPKSIEYIDFGKYKGKKFSELPTGYLEWLINNHSSNEIKNKSRDELLIRRENTTLILPKLEEDEDVKEEQTVKKTKSKETKEIYTSDFKEEIKKEFGLDDEFIKKLEKQQRDYKKEVEENKIYYSLKYEKFICNFYRQKGYQVNHIGMIIKDGKEIPNKDDGGIDIIATKDGYKTKFIQCKYWTKSYEESEYHLTHNIIKEFLGNCFIYFTNEKINEIANYDFVLTMPTIYNLQENGCAENHLKNNKQVKLEIVPMLKDKIKLIIGIIEAERVCTKCRRATKVIAIKFYNSYELRIINKEQIIYYISELPKDLLEKIKEKYPKYDHKRPAKNGFTYLANHCEHENCDRVQGDKYLYDDEEGVFYNVDDLEPKYYIAYNENTETLEYISEFYN